MTLGVTLLERWSSSLGFSADDDNLNILVDLASFQVLYFL
jgi:hypothetical protein